MKFIGGFLLAMVLLFCTNSFAQNQYSYTDEFHIQSDNDAYLFRLRDGYYTNGLILGWTYLPKKQPEVNSRKAEKRISYYRIGQKIFNSENWRYYLPEQIDRPFAGYLFAEKGYRIFYQSGDVLDVSLSAGTIGPSSYGKEIQSMLHRWLGFARIRGWDYQVRDEAGVHAIIRFDKHISGKPEKSLIQLRASGEGSLGNLFTYAKAGGLILFGKTEKPDRSAWYHARVGKERKQRRAEIFGYLHPQVLFQAYNATVQGGFFSEDKGSVTADLDKFTLLHDLGVVFAQDRWSSSISFTRKQKEATSMRRNELFGSIKVSYRFGKKIHLIEHGFTTNDNTDSK